MRRMIVAGNWKMNKTVGEATDLARALKDRLANVVGKVDIVVIPPFTDLLAVGEILKESDIGLGAQNLHWEVSGAYTGEISAEMIKSTDAEYVVVGHSERRQLFGETNETINKRLKRAFASGLVPILCIGETLAQRESNETHQVLATQMREALVGISKEDLARLIMAYEPVWAIGTGVNASPEQAEEAHQFIREQFAQLGDRKFAEQLRIQYGGSVKPGNARVLLAKPNVDGALVGGASLDAESFAEIAKAAL